MFWTWWKWTWWTILFRASDPTWRNILSFMNELNSRNSSTSNPVWSKFKDRRGGDLTLGMISYSDRVFSMFLNSFSLLGRWLGHGIGRRNISPRQKMYKRIYLLRKNISSSLSFQALVFQDIYLSFLCHRSPWLHHKMANQNSSRPHYSTFKFSWLSQLLQHGPFISKLGSGQPTTSQFHNGAIPGLPEPSSLGSWQ